MKKYDVNMRTTLNINDAILQELRERAQTQGRPFREVVEEALSLGLVQLSKTAQKKKQFTVKPHSLGLKSGFHAVSLNQLYDQLETEGTARNQ